MVVIGERPDDLHTGSLLVPAVFFVLAEGFKVASQAQPVMAADHSAALRALPFLRFLCEECLHSVISDACQIFDHAQMIFRTVTFIQGFQAFAGELLAFKTKAHQPLTQQLAISF